MITLATRVPEDVWGSQKKAAPESEAGAGELLLWMKFESEDIRMSRTWSLATNITIQTRDLACLKRGRCRYHLATSFVSPWWGSAKTVEDTKEFFEEAASGFAGNGEKHPNLHPDFPGLGNQNPFRCKFEVSEGATAAITQAKDRQNQARAQITSKRLRWPGTRLSSNLKSLDETSHRPNVAIVALPVALLERVWNAKVDAKGTTEEGGQWRF